MKLVTRKSVRGIIEYVLRCGSIDDSHTSRTRAVDGTIAHSKLQKDNEKIYDNYEKEVSLECSFDFEDVNLMVYGRADGIIKEKEIVIIEEIKSTYKDLLYIEEDYNLLHWAQNKFYGYMYCINNQINDITIRLSYYNLNTNEVKSFDKTYGLKELENFVDSIVKPYIDTLVDRLNFKDKRDISIKNQKFPFEKYRKGQRELALTCFNTIKQKGILFAQAPTGIGKTMSTIFPSLKSLSEGRGNRIVYLTSKTITRVVAEESYSKLFKQGLQFRLISLTAKEKICLNKEVKCNPIDCPYAVDYFSKINRVISEILLLDNIFGKENILDYAEKFKMCPFELSLDLAEVCDGIICDYNYAFDPSARLKRIFEESNEDNIVLIDEAHNLVNRLRDMYSAQLNKSNVLEVARTLKGRAPTLYKSINSVNKEMIAIRGELEEKTLNILYKNDEYKELIKLLRVFIVEADEYLIRNKNIDNYKVIRDFYFDVRRFVSTSELYSTNYTTILKKENNDFSIKLFCINPAQNISNIISTAHSTILFSATLSPIKYYVNLLGGDENSYRMTLESPFNKENLKTLVYPLNMRYVNRDKNIDALCYIIKKFIDEVKGNYMIFLPSFEYLNKVSSKYKELYDENILVQSESLNEDEKEEFLSEFKGNSKVTAFTVVGGMFSEGIDLPGELLIGAIVVGVGFPKVSIENDIIKDYFKENGFDYAYAYPGINKVLQSVGRIIRTEEDKGRALLIDDRYLLKKYKTLLPKQWHLTIYK